jgi:hypothetical protein
VSSIHTIIQHHPSRAELLPDLIARLGNLEPVVVTDPGAGFETRGQWNAWRGFRACLEACPENTGHLLIVQDDALPCPGFDNAARTALAMRPDVMVCFYVGGGRVGDPLVHAAVRCVSWAPLNRDLWVPLVATAFPRAIVTDLLAWADKEPYAARAKGDDAVLGRFMRDKGLTAWATIPNLVQHEDMVPSIMRRTSARGTDRNRTAVCWIGDEDVASIQW